MIGLRSKPTTTDVGALRRQLDELTGEVAEIDATRVSDTDHVTLRPLSVAPAASRVAATNASTSPTLAVSGRPVMLTDATGVGGGGAAAFSPLQAARRPRTMDLE